MLRFGTGALSAAVLPGCGGIAINGQAAIAWRSKGLTECERGTSWDIQVDALIAVYATDGWLWGRVENDGPGPSFERLSEARSGVRSSSESIKPPQPKRLWNTLERAAATDSSWVSWPRALNPTMVARLGWAALTLDVCSSCYFHHHRARPSVGLVHTRPYMVREGQSRYPERSDQHL